MATITPINVGTIPNDNTGDSLRNAFIKVNTNEANLNTGITTNVAITGGNIDGTIIGATTATTGTFTGVIATTGDLTFKTTTRGINVSVGDVATSFDIDFPEISTAVGEIRLFRNTNTTGGYNVTYFRGNGTTGTQHRLSSENLDSLLCLQGGNLGVFINPPLERVHVGGNILATGTIKATTVIETGSFTVATLPSASATPNGIIKVSDETGGETLAFSDGTNFRRVQDRAIVA